MEGGTTCLVASLAVRRTNGQTLLRLRGSGLCSNAFAFASANAAFALALALDCPSVDAFAFDSSAFALAFDSNAFDWNQMRNKCESNAKQIRIK